MWLVQSATCSDACSVNLIWVFFRGPPVYKFIIKWAHINLYVTPVDQLWMKVLYPMSAGVTLGQDLVK